jgi:redox-sensitive bicupin YhaK (pirin superfamily)
MKFTSFLAKNRGGADHGWLKAKHTFSFGSWYDPNQMHFGALRVLNDDWIAGGEGFGTHPHDNMEIITIPHSGALEHKDSMGNQGIIKAGDVQVMSAGTGIKHSEFNHHENEACTLFQIWIIPKIRGVVPRYDQRTFDKSNMQNNWVPLVSPIGYSDEALKIHQDAFLSVGYFNAGEIANYTIHKPGNGLFIQNIKGSFSVSENQLNDRDALGVWELESIAISFEKDSEVLLIEVPML